MASAREIVVTGLGVVSPIGIGLDAFWNALGERRSGVHRLGVFDGSDLPNPIGADVADFDPKQYVRPRKSLKVMSRDIQLGFAAADMACRESRLDAHSVDPDRLGIVFGADMIACDLNELRDAFAGCMREGEFDFQRWGDSAMTEMYPLWMLKYLPNMPACHVGIAQDARGPNNSLTMGEVSSLAALAEASRVIERGQADVMIAGGTGCRVHPTIWAYRRAYPLSHRLDDPTRAMRPFDADRDGMVHGEGAAAVVLESRHHAEARGAPILARLLGFAARYEPQPGGREPDGQAVRNAIAETLRQTGVRPEEIDHVNADGLGTPVDDRLEAHAIRDVLGDVPVTAPKSYFGNLGAGTGAVEMAVSLLAFDRGEVPPTLNYDRPDPDCPVNVIHGDFKRRTKTYAIVLSHSRIVQSIAVMLGAP
ncbi:MAG: beta-ketoacyl-[acyl-carrier-protein] synthase family protein [Pirellulales bacterium]|nr:beta-ketoacyl-[acyl-carrier-protein] synthase family protein [Pirellulales bacterium]